MKDIYVIAHNIRSLYNVGALFRLCDGVGVRKLYLTGTTGAPFDRIKYARQRAHIAKTALEALDNVDWEYHETPYSLMQNLQQQQVAMYALEQTPRSVDYTVVKYPEKVCLILGNETDGVSQELLDLCDTHIELPMHGAGKSLNVVIATAVALYHLQHGQ